MMLTLRIAFIFLALHDTHVGIYLIDGQIISPSVVGHFWDH